MNDYKKEIIFGSALLLVGFIILISGINIGHFPIVNDVYKTGIGSIILLGGFVSLYKTKNNLDYKPKGESG